MKSELLNDNLYQIPSCTICLQQLHEDLSSLACGHIFHINCISQHFQYRGTCPNCQKRASCKEIRLVVYPVVRNNHADVQFRTILAGLNNSQYKQVHELLKEIKKCTEINDTLTQKNFECQKQILQLKKQQIIIKQQLKQKKAENIEIKKQNIEQRRMNDHLQVQRQELEMDEIRLRGTLDDYKKHERQYDQLKKLKKIMSQNSQDIVNYKHELQNNMTSSDDMAKLFFQMLMIKNLEVLKIKEKIKQFPEKIIDKDYQIGRIKNIMQGIKKENKQIQDKRQIERKKYDQLKCKYRCLLEKIKKDNHYKEGDLPEYQDSMGAKIDQQPTIKKQMTTLSLVSTLSQQKSIQPSFNKEKSTFQSFGGSNKLQFKKKADDKSNQILMKNWNI